MLTIEFDPPHECAPCACCGGHTTVLTRFVYSDGDAFAIYYARFSDNHPDRVVLATVSLGEWGEDSTSRDRVAFSLKIWPGESQHNVTVLDAADSPWRDVEVIGKTLDREDALKHPRLKDVFHVTDHMVLNDDLIRNYLERASSTG